MFEVVTVKNREKLRQVIHWGCWACKGQCGTFRSADLSGMIFSSCAGTGEDIVAGKDLAFCNTVDVT